MIIILFFFSIVCVCVCVCCVRACVCVCLRVKCGRPPNCVFAGAAVVASKEFIALLRQSPSSAYRFSTSLPPSSIFAASYAFSVFDSPRGQELRNRLHDNSLLLRDQLRTIGISTLVHTCTYSLSKEIRSWRNYYELCRWFKL
eukprot:Pompholyxophrys_punicea_v1_NODE_1035_length_1024_cov_2.723426.p1 type:complete len:143 gc:universal NODE_1035_length_1024_cov_2.723426:87-515(+)